MKPTFHCIPCHINHIYRVVSKLTLDENTKLCVMQQLTRIIAGNFSTPPDCAYEMYKAIRKWIGHDPFADIKKESNALMMSLLPQLQTLLQGDTLQQALRIALAANIIDYGIGDMEPETDYLATFKTLVNNITVPNKFYNQFTKTISDSQRILYIADNAGEIVADMLLMEQLPIGKIVCVVRGGPVINDATMEDVRHIGLDRKVRVITTGDPTPGINVHRCSDEFLNELSQADMIILKGQGNFETMIDAPLEGLVKNKVKLFFIFKVKCLPVAEYIHKYPGDNAFIIREI